MNPGEHEILSVLSEIYDPCSISAGTPLSLTEMGLVEKVAIDEAGSVTICLRLTSPGCQVGVFVFEPEIQERLGQLDGIRSVTVEYGDPLTWTEDAISEDGRRRLSESRNASRVIKIHPREGRSGSDSR